MDVDPPVVADTQAAELVQPGECPLHHPTPLPQAAAVPRLAHSEDWENMTNSQRVADAPGIVGTIAEYAVWTTPGSPSFALQRRDRIDQRQGFLRIVPVGSGQADGKWHARPVADQMTLASALGPVSGIRPGLASTTHCPHRAAIDNGSRPIDLVVTREPIEQREVHQVTVPVACQSRRRRQHVIPDLQPSSRGNICQGMPLRRTKQNTSETRAIRDAWPSTLRSRWWTGSGSTRSHNAFGSSAPAIPVNANAPQ
jgi:hypothetical protein